MSRVFVKSIYNSIVKENVEIERRLFETTIVGPRTDEYWRAAIGLYNSLDEENRSVLMRIIEQTMVDTISNMLGIIDGSSTLKDCSVELKLLMDGNDAEGELQDSFLAFIEETNEEL